MKSESTKARRADYDDRLEYLDLLSNRLALKETCEASIAGRKVSELSDPLIEHGEGQFLFIFLDLHAVVNYDLTKISPLGYILRQIIELSDLFFLVVYEMLDLFE